MHQQDSLWPQSRFAVQTRQERRAPSLWVRRLAIWKDPDNLLRDVRLRRGLNIVWSPDPADRRAEDSSREAHARVPAVLGHGSGKTLFCRLLRYCLGEPSFAASDQRMAIGARLPQSLAGAEVVVEGVVWA